jgi:ribosomal protein S18 acetylase RimI-like enzyme
VDSNYTLVRVTAADVGLFAAVADDVFDAPIRPKRLRAFLREPRHLMMVALHEGRIIGQARGQIHLSPDQADSFFLDNLGVAPSMQRLGIGRELVDGMFAWARERGCRTGWLGTELDNHAARALYAGRGGQGLPVMLFEFEKL